MPPVHGGNGALVNQPGFGEAFTCQTAMPCSANLPSRSDLALSEALVMGETARDSRVFLPITHDPRSRRPAPTERRMAAPIADQQPAEQHAAEMCEMRDTGLKAAEAKQQFDHAVTR